MVRMESLFILQFLFLKVDSKIAKHGCQDRCGNVSIPFPFGTREDCYLGLNFWITCNATTNTSYLRDSTTRVLNISLNGQLRISSPVAKDCHNKQGILTHYNHAWSNMVAYYLPAYALNKFFAVGCNIEATMSVELYNMSCKTYCDSDKVKSNGSCSGGGCCQLSIPRGTSDFNLTLERKRKTDIDAYPCSYAFIVEDGFYDFNFRDLLGLQEVDTFPVVFYWTIGSATCAIAKSDLSSYACKDPNSVCLNSDKKPGYLCNCSRGFLGNPYLSNGCKDINECADPSLNDCTSTSTCRNTMGSYACICSRGYYGDGTKNGPGCRANLGKFFAIIGVASGIGFLLLLLGFWLLYKLVKRRQEKKTRKKFFKRNGGLLLEQQLSSTEKHVEHTKIFSSKELEIATDNYHADRILGQGGQGTVYKGMLIDGRVVAIKKSKVVDDDKLDQFINEVVILSQINHRNIVKLFGCCLETEVPLLVYEFIPNGSLFEFLHDHKEREFPLKWGMRLQIAAEVAGAVAYLHSSASMPIYHRDIKTSNILLDERYRAKVADFGTSKTISIDKTHVTTQVQGTYGYIDPEYFQSSQFTEKSDVYSFGVVLVELLTGEKAISMLRSVEGRSLVTYFLETMRDDRLFEIVDGGVLKVGRKKEIIAIANLAKTCLNLYGKKRPNMKTVAMELERIRSCEGVSSISEQEFDYEVGEYNVSWEITSHRSQPLVLATC